MQKLQVHGVHHGPQIIVIARDGCERTEIDLRAVRKTGENITFSISFTRARLLADVKIWNSGPESGDAWGVVKSAAGIL